MSLLQAIILAIIEGLTEFLPVSSTGHMILASDAMGIADNPFTKLFEVGIQFGAILAVVVLYYKDFFKSVQFYIKLFIAFIPAAIMGKLLGDYIDQWLENPVGVSIALIVGGVVLLYVDNFFKANENKNTSIEKDVNYLSAFKIGAFQVLALFPGVSRSASTIIGGLSQNLNRKTAAEFSFFLAVPTMFAATVYKLYKFHKEVGIVHSDINILLIGNVIAFIVAIIAIKSFIGILNRYGFAIFGFYRIFIGIILLIIFAIQKYGIV
ncbi:MAG: undecaprenyl-diphosphate phosphatase [Bacteroidota bacterium]